MIKYKKMKINNVWFKQRHVIYVSGFKFKSINEEKSIEM